MSTHSSPTLTMAISAHLENLRGSMTGRTMMYSGALAVFKWRRPTDQCASVRSAVSKSFLRRIVAPRRFASPADAQQPPPSCGIITSMTVAPMRTIRQTMSSSKASRSSRGSEQRSAGHCQAERTEATPCGSTRRLARTSDVRSENVRRWRCSQVLS